MTTTADTSPRSRRRERLMREIQGAALALFEAHGYDSTTVDDVAQAADVSVRTVFRHFPSKEDLVFWSTYSPRLPGLMAEQDAYIPAVESLQRSLTQGLGATFGADIEVVKRWARIGFRTPSLRPRMHAQQHAIGQLFTTLLRDRAPSGTPPLRVKVTGAALAAALFVALDEWQLRDASPDLQGLIAQCLHDAIITLDF
jgi:AcrR family transcriptional regulator